MSEGAGLDLFWFLCASTDGLGISELIVARKRVAEEGVCMDGSPLRLLGVVEMSLTDGARGSLGLVAPPISGS